MTDGAFPANSSNVARRGIDTRHPPHSHAAHCVRDHYDGAAVHDVDTRSMKLDIYGIMFRKHGVVAKSPRTTMSSSPPAANGAEQPSDAQNAEANVKAGSPNDFLKGTQPSAARTD